MAGNKYFYNGIPLTDYCKNNGINVDTVRTRIWKKLKDPKYKNYAKQQIVDMVIEAYGTLTKYNYGGISLRQYCINNGIITGSMHNRITRLKKSNPELTDDELVKLAMEEYEDGRRRYFYYGIPLKDFCESNPELDYNTLREFLRRESKRQPEKTIENLIDEYSEKEHKGMYKWYYCGIPLKIYCESRDLNYKNIISFIHNRRKTTDFSSLSNDDFIEYIMEIYSPKPPPYMHKGQLLKSYCKEHNIKYFRVISYIKTKLENDPNMNIDSLIEEALKVMSRYARVYYYDGIPLKDYAESHDMNYNSLRGIILRKISSTDLPTQEIVNMCVKAYKKLTIKYFYNGEKLTSFCQRTQLDYRWIVRIYLSEYAEDKKTSVDLAISSIVESILNGSRVRTKYYFDNQSLMRFCDAKGYSYSALWHRMKNLKEKDSSLSKEELIEKAVTSYEDRLHIKMISETFRKLKSDRTIDFEELKSICDKLNIDFDNVLELLDMGFNYNQAINLIWYFSDIKNENGQSIITDVKIEEIFFMLNKLKSSTETTIDEFDLYFLIGIYKSELYDSRNEILLRQRKFITKTIYTLSRDYDVSVNRDNIEDFESEIKMYLILFIDRVHLNVYGQIIRYMVMTVKGYFRSFLGEYKRCTEIASLGESKYQNSDKTAPSRLDYISTQLTEEPSKFSDDMLQVLSSLPKDDLTYIILRFQENYNQEELAEHFQLEVDEVLKKEERIISFLRDNPEIKKFRITTIDR